MIRSFAQRLPDRERDQLLADCDNALAETVTHDGSRVTFSIVGYQRPSYRGQHPFAVEGKVADLDGAELSVLLHADEHGRLLELELVRFDDGDVLKPNWSTLQHW